MIKMSVDTSDNNFDDEAAKYLGQGIEVGTSHSKHGFRSK